MPDKGAVIEGLKQLKKFLYNVYKTAPVKEENIWFTQYTIVSDAIVLLEHEIVRCGDCKHFGQGESGPYSCALQDMRHPNSNWYCPHGERR